MKWGQTHGGKGSSQRKAADPKKFSSNWDAIYKKSVKKVKKKKQLDFISLLWYNIEYTTKITVLPMEKQ